MQRVASSIMRDVEFDPILVAFFDGLVETKHPFNLMASEGIKALLATSVDMTDTECEA